MKSLATLKNLSTNLSNNTSASNDALMIQLLTDRHRYLIQKYFDNERTVQTTTVGGQSLTTTASLSANATSATLTAAWTYPTNTQLVNFSNGDQRSVLFTLNSTAITWTAGLSSSATTAITTVGVQDYTIPANISKIKDNTINVGQLKYQPVPVQTRQEWDMINFLPYTSDIPNYFFIYNGKLSIFPIPSTTGNILTFNYKTRVPDFSTAFLFSDTSGTAYVAGQTSYDYQNGSLSGITNGSVSITGSGTSWNTTGKFPLNVDVSQYNLFLTINPPSGDGIAYPILQFNSDTSLTLATPIVNTYSTTTAAHGYSIGQYPLLFEDFQDMLVYGVMKIYFSSIFQDANKYKEFDALYQERLVMLEDYIGTKSLSVDLGEEPQQVNPNLFLYSNT